MLPVGGMSVAKQKLFVSYRRVNWSFTYWLAIELGGLLDADIFVDYSGVDETDFEKSLLRNLRESDAVLLIVTEQTFDSARIQHDKDWVRREIREALTSILKNTSGIAHAKRLVTAIPIAISHRSLMISRPI